jgi:hypothetical protein
MSFLRPLPLLILAFFWLSGASAKSPTQPGDRVAVVGNTYADQLRIHGYLETLLLQRSGDKPVSIRNLGWGGDLIQLRDRPTNFPSEASTLTSHKTDVILICFGMGESFAGKAGLSDFRSQLKRFIAAHKGKKYNGESPVRIVLVSPIAHEDHGELSPNRKKRNDDLAAYVGAMQQVAVAESIPFVDLYAPTLYLMDDKASPKLTEQGIHLNSYGYWATGRMVADKLLPGQPTWWLSVDAKSRLATARGAKLSAVKQQGRGLRFTLQEISPPHLSPPVEGKIHDNLATTRDTLVVSNLAPGQYLLTVDGQAVAEGSHQQWAEGVAVDASPAHKAAEAYRQKVNDKNLQFTYSWKALNQVHIVGERRSSASGKSLPEEVIAFGKLADQRDEALQAGIELKTREWRLVPQ